MWPFLLKLKKSFWPRELPGATPKVLRILGNGRKLSLNADFSCMSNKDYIRVVRFSWSLKPRQTPSVERDWSYADRELDGR